MGENDMIVAVWFEMRRAELTGRRVNKVSEDRKLRELWGRNRGSIEFRHRNISVAARPLRLPVLACYRLRFNSQMSLVEATSFWLARHPGWDADLSLCPQGVAEAQHLCIGVPPTLRNQPVPEAAARLDAVPWHVISTWPAGTNVTAHSAGLKLNRPRRWWSADPLRSRSPGIDAQAAPGRQQLGGGGGDGFARYPG